MKKRHASLAITDYLDDPRQDEVVAFLTNWVSRSRSDAEQHVADHQLGGGTTLVGRVEDEVAGTVTIRWLSNHPDFARRNVPLLHQISVAEHFKRQGVASTLMDAAEALARSRDVLELGITVGLFAEYGPAQRMYAKRCYVPDGRGICVGQTPVSENETVRIGHDVVLWMTKALVSNDV